MRGQQIVACDSGFLPLTAELVQFERARLEGGSSVASEKIHRTRQTP